MPLFIHCIYVPILTFRLNPIFTSKSLLIEVCEFCFFHLGWMFFKWIELVQEKADSQCLLGQILVFTSLVQRIFCFIFLPLQLGVYISFILIDDKEVYKPQDIFFRAYLIESETFYPFIYCLKKSNQTNVIIWLPPDFVKGTRLRDKNVSDSFVLCYETQP